MRHNRDIATWVVVFAFLLLVLSGLAHGQECRTRELSTQPHYVPTGVFCEIGDGLTCFTLDEYKKLREMDSELYTAKEKARETDGIIENQGLIIQQKDIVITSLEKDKTILEGQTERIGEKWRTCLAEQEGVPWSSIGLGAAAGVVVGVLTGVIAYLAVQAVQSPG